MNAGQSSSWLAERVVTIQAADSAPAPTRSTRSTCPYCGVGCGVIIESQGEQITGVRGDPNHPANLGKLCSKGSPLPHTSP